MSFFEFPHTRTYDSDLGWLIKSMEELLDEYNNLIAWRDQHNIDYGVLVTRVTTLERNIASFEAEIERRFSNLETQLTNKIDIMLAEAIADISNQLGDIKEQIHDLASALARQRIELEGRIEATEDYCNLYTDNAIQELINSLPDLTTINVFNPIKGEVTNIQTAINDLYDLGRSEALTALEYDILGLTASEYDNLELTAIQYDQYGRYYFDLNGLIINPFHYMTSPFTGELVKLEVVINELASLHKDDTLTASEYDALSLDADYYDNLEVTAFDYDWHSKTLVA